MKCLGKLVKDLLVRFDVPILLISSIVGPLYEHGNFRSQSAAIYELCQRPYAERKAIAYVAVS